MDRANLIYELIKYGLINDNTNFRKAAETLCAGERVKQHKVLADKIQELLTNEKKYIIERNSSVNAIKSGMSESNLFWEKSPEKRIDNLVLPQAVKDLCQSIIDEQMKAEILQSYGLEPRNKMLLIGPPGNGKTSLAEAMAEALMVPLLVVRYESIIGAYLGETAARLSKLFDIAKTRKCVLFFDEFEILGKERGDAHETGEIKRVVSSLLMQIDILPSYVVAIAATNHDTLLDKAAWRRFQVKVEVPKPTKFDLEIYFDNFQRDKGIDFGISSSVLARKTVGLSYAEAEELALEICRQYYINLPNVNIKNITNQVLNLWQTQKIIGKELKEEKKCQKDQ